MATRSKITKSAGELFSSLPLAVGLVGLLTFLAAVGTFLPPGADQSWITNLPSFVRAVVKILGVGDFFHSILFQTVTGLLALNLSTCAVKRLWRGWRAFRNRGTLPGHLTTAVVSPDSPEAVADRLRKNGYILREKREGMTATRKKWWAFRTFVVHLSMPIIVLGGWLSGTFGYVGTVWAPEGGAVSNFYDWSSREEHPFPLPLIIQRVELDYYPMDLRVGLLWKKTGKKEDPVVTVSGESFSLPGTSYSAKIVRVSRDIHSAEVQVLEDDQVVAEIRAGPDQPTSSLPFDLFLVDYRGAVPKRIGVKALLVDDEVQPVQFGINQPLTADGHTVTLTDYKPADPGEQWLAGLQISYAPGLPLVWAGFVLLIIGLAAYAVPVREARIIDDPQGSRLLLRGLAPKSRLLSEARVLAGKEE